MILRTWPQSFPHILVVCLMAGAFLAWAPAHGADLVPGDRTSAEHIQAESEMTAVAWGLASWLTDQVGKSPGLSSRAIGCGIHDVEDVPSISHVKLAELLVPDYLVAVPELDPWGTAYDYRFSGLNQPHWAAIRSAGADGLFEGNEYTAGYTSGPTEDLLWLDGFWIRRQPLSGAIERQDRAFNDIRNAGTAMMSWLTDQVGFCSSPESRSQTVGTVIDMSNYQPIDYSTLSAMLAPQYIHCLPELDPWGVPYDYRLNPDILGLHVVAVRSSSQDGLFESDIYSTGPFPADDFERDLVWADGFFVAYPDGVHSTVFTDGFEFGLWGVWGTVP